MQELIFTAKRVGAPEAVRLGLLDHCVDQGKAMERALELARDAAQVCWLAATFRPVLALVEPCRISAACC